LGRFSVFIPTAARPGGQGTRLKPCPDTAPAFPSLSVVEIQLGRV
jgi:hypothetical protein